MDPDNLSSSETSSGGSNGGKTGKGGKAVYQKGGKTKTKAGSKPSWIPSKYGKPSDGEHGGKPSMSSVPQDGQGEVSKGYDYEGEGQGGMDEGKRKG